MYCHYKDSVIKWSWELSLGIIIVLVFFYALMDNTHHLVHSILSKILTPLTLHQMTVAPWQAKSIKAQ